MLAKTNRPHGAQRTGVVFAQGRAILAGAAAAAILLLVGTAVSYARADPSEAAQPIALCALYLSAAVCGFCAGRASDHAVPAGACAGGLYCLLVTALSLIPATESGGGYSLGISTALHAGIIAASVAGAWLGRRRSKRPSAPYRKRRR